MSEIILQNDPRLMELVRICRKCEHLGKKDKSSVWLTEEFPDGMYLVCTNNTFSNATLHLDWKAGLLYDFENQRWHNKKICGKYTPRKTPPAFDPCCNCTEYKCFKHGLDVDYCEDRKKIAARLARDGVPAERIMIRKTWLDPTLPASTLDDRKTPYKWWE